MTLEMIKQILANKLTSLNNQRVNFAAIGDLEQLARLDEEINETQATIDQLAGL